jgi:hypothetical protein
LEISEQKNGQKNLINFSPELQLYPLLRYGLLAVSIFNILAITINRYVMIAHPTAYPR